MQLISLKDKALAGIVWSACDKVFVRVIQFIIGILIARILMPSDYGLVGMIMIFITLSNIFIDSGFSQALIQKQDRTSTDINSVFYFNIVVSTVCYLIIWFIAPCIAIFYDIPLLKSVLRILSSIIIINSLSAIQRTILLINIDFKSIAIVNIVSSLFGGCTGLIMAYNGCGYWSIVFQTICSQIISLCLLWSLGNFRPTFNISLDSIKVLWKFGSRLLIAATISTIIREINSIIIGKFYKASELGYYHRAVQTTDTISSTINEIINAVTFPVLSLVHENQDRLISIYTKMLSMTTFIIFPIMTLLAIMSEPIIKILLTDKWLPVVPLMQWLCFARILTPISSLNMNILNAIGRSDLFLKVDMYKIPIVLGVMCLTLPISVKAVVIGSLISGFICYLINKLYGIGFKVQFLIVFRVIINTAIMAFLTCLAMRLVDSIILQLFLGSLVALISYLVGAYFLRLQQLKLLIEILKDKFLEIKHKE